MPNLIQLVHRTTITHAKPYSVGSVSDLDLIAFLPDNVIKFDWPVRLMPMAIRSTVNRTTTRSSWSYLIRLVGAV